MAKKTGFRELSDHSVNIQLGCEHNCRYCWARADAVDRYHRCTDGQWVTPVINQEKVDLPWRRKYKGVVAFPTCHDITDRNMSEYLCVLRKLLDAGNDVRITTKASWPVIPVICEAYLDYKPRIHFTFTLGSTNDNVLGFWEPGAPNYAARLGCLEYAYFKGYRTSVICEPYLDGWAVQLYESVKDYITEEFWLGKLNKFEKRVCLEGVTDEQMNRFVRPLKLLLGDDYVMEMVRALAGRPHVKFKESVQAVIDKSKK